PLRVRGRAEAVGRSGALPRGVAGVGPNRARGAGVRGRGVPRVWLEPSGRAVPARPGHCRHGAASGGGRVTFSPPPWTDPVPAATFHRAIRIFTPKSDMAVPPPPHEPGGIHRPTYRGPRQLPR